jgi:thiol-disulfide isomerase/thioredoxin
MLLLVLRGFPDMIARMKRPNNKIIAAFLIVAVIAIARMASAEVPSADQVLAPAKSRAAAEHKTIFVHFGASWCPWCRRLDAFLDRPEVKPAFEKYFIPVKLVVQERDEKKALENPGAGAVLKDLGAHGGLPFMVFVDAQGAVIANSELKGQNIGFPAEPEEIDWFVQMMKKAAPGMAEADMKVIETALKSAKK